MEAVPQPRSDRRAPAPAKPGKPLSLAKGNGGTAAAPPPHRLWETLETAYAAPEQAAEPEEPRLAGYIAMPVVLGLSLLLWVVIVGIVLMR